MESLISIIIPCYNSQEYLAECLNSVINQTYPFWEALCVDDGSTDETSEILEEFARRETRIKVFHQKNSGVSVARNNALSHCKGDFFCFVDSDDMIASNYLKKLLQIISPTVDLALCDFSRTMMNSDESVVENEKMTSSDFINRIICNKIFRPQICCMLFRTSLMKKEKLFFWKGCARGEDREFFMKYIVNAREIMYVKSTLYYYRVNDLSAMAMLNEKSLTSIEAAERTALFYRQINHPMVGLVESFFYYTIWKYMVLSTLEHKFYLFSILENKYDLNGVMRALHYSPQLSVRLTSDLYRISKTGFKVLLSIVGYFFLKK